MAIEPQEQTSVYADTTANLEGKLTSQDISQAQRPLPKKWYQRHPHWYHFLVLLVCLIGLAGAGFLTYGIYHAYLSDRQNVYADGIKTGYTLGNTDGNKTGYAHGLQDQTTQDGKLLAKTKAADAQLLATAKYTSYTTGYSTGKADATNALKQWWNAHCTYDKVVASYVCNQNP